MTTGKLLATAGILLALVSLSLLPAIAQSYTVTDLGTVSGKGSVATAINDVGQVAGYSRNAFLWSSETGMRDLGVLNVGDLYSLAYAVNNSSEVVGVSYSPTGGRGGFLWTASSGMMDIGSLGGGLTTAYGMNDAEQVVGESALPDGSVHAFLWSRSGGMQDLGTLGGGSLSSARAVNSSGVVVGYAVFADGMTTHAFRWTQSTGMQDMGTLGGDSSFATCLNDAGQVSGYSSETLDSPVVAFLWTQQRGMLALTSMPATEPFGINLGGQVVGIIGQGLRNEAGFLWTKAGGLHNLNALISHQDSSLIAAFAINKVGQIAGWGSNNHAWLLTPIK